jgi:signal transduction histidine kinase
MARGRLLLIDVVLVMALAVTSVAQLWWSPPEGLVGGRVVHTVLAAAFTLPLLLRRRHPVAVFAVVAAAAWLQLELGGGLGQPFFAVVIALYAVGAHAPSPSTYVGPALVALQAVLVDVPRLRAGDPWDEVIPTWFVLLGLWAFGRWMRHRALAASALVERAEATERDQARQAAHAVASERARISRELHDLVAHSMSVIVIQAQGAQRAMDSAPEQAREAMRSVETAARGGLEEMRRLLGLLTDANTTDGTSPQPSLEQLPDLIAQLGATGMPVDLRIEGSVRRLPAGLELTGYRIVQEATTNALKHAGPVPVDVRLSYRGDCLDIEVTDAGPTPDVSRSAPPAGGHGLVGMQERVALYGGTVHARSRPGGGFTVQARLPIAGGTS